MKLSPGISIDVDRRCNGNIPVALMNGRMPRPVIVDFTRVSCISCRCSGDAKLFRRIVFIAGCASGEKSVDRRARDAPLALRPGREVLKESPRCQWLLSHRCEACTESPKLERPPQPRPKSSKPAVRKPASMSASFRLFSCAAPRLLIGV